MDRFKFRIFDKRDNKLKAIDQFSLSDCNRYIALWYEDRNYEALIDIKHIVLMQCTGRKDVNNKLIHEGDLFLKDNCDCAPIMIVAYCKSCFKFTAYNTEEKEECEMSCEDLLNFDEIKIIGNIHTNPELI
jgi:uncharacterized phage protein (TIGR01671 family)